MTSRLGHGAQYFYDVGFSDSSSDSEDDGRQIYSSRDVYYHSDDELQQTTRPVEGEPEFGWDDDYYYDDGYDFGPGTIFQVPFNQRSPAIAINRLQHGRSGKEEGKRFVDYNLMVEEEELELSSKYGPSFVVSMATTAKLDSISDIDSDKKNEEREGRAEVRENEKGKEKEKEKDDGVIKKASRRTLGRSRSLSPRRQPQPQSPQQATPQSEKKKRKRRRSKKTNKKSSNTSSPQLQPQPSPLLLSSFASSSASRNPYWDSWCVTISSTDSVHEQENVILELVMTLPSGYPMTPPLFNLKLSPATDSGNDATKQSEIGTTPTTNTTKGRNYRQQELALLKLLMDRADQMIGRPMAIELTEIAKEFIVSMIQHMRAQEEREKATLLLKQQQKEEEEDRALEKALDPTPQTSFKQWLKKVGMYVQSLPVLPDMESREEDFEKTLKLAKRKFKRTSGQSMLSLWQICIEAIGDSLHRYESFEGVPIQIKSEITNYLTKIGVFTPGHMKALLDPEQVRLDCSALSRSLTDRHLATIGTDCPNLRVVDMGGCSVGDLTFQSLSLCHQLTQFTANGCPLLDSRMIGDLAKGCPLLTTFSVSNCPLLSHSGVMAIARRCIDLRVLILNGCAGVSLDTIVNAVRMAKKIEHIEAQGTGTAMPYSPATVAYNSHTNRRLRYADLSGCTQATSIFLMDFLGPSHHDKCPALQNLSLKGCHLLAVDTHLLQKVLIRCPALRWLDLSLANQKREAKNPCLAIFDVDLQSDALESREALLPNSKRAPKPKEKESIEVKKERMGSMRKALASLTKFSMVGNQGFTTKSTFASSFTRATFVGFELNLMKCLRRMTNLRFLDLSNNIILTKSFLVLAYQSFPHLETLKLSRTYAEVIGINTTITLLFDESPSEPLNVPDNGKPCESLKDLDLTACTFLNNTLLIDLIAFRCPNLERLTLDGVTSLGELSVLRMLEICVKLKYLSVNGCKFTEYAVAAIRGKGDESFIVSAETEVPGV